MKQYLLSIYQPDGPPPADLDLTRIMRDVHALRDEMKRAGAWVFSGGLHDAEHRDGRAREGRRAADDRRPVHRGQGTPWRIHDHQGRRSRCRARMGSQARPGARAAGDRGTAVPGRRHALTHGDRAGLSRGVRARRGRPGPPIRRHRHRRGSGPGRVHHGGAAMAVDRAAAEPGRMDHHNGAATAPSIVSAAKRRVRIGTRRPMLTAGPRRSWRTGGGRGARRTAAADLHLLSSGARAQRAGRADAAPARRAHDRRRSHARFCAGRDHGPAAGAREGQDPRCADPVSRAERRRLPGRLRARAGGDLSDLQRGLHRELGRATGPRRSVRGSIRLGRLLARAHARRAGSHGPARADAADRVAPRGAGLSRTASSCCSPTRIAAGGIAR